MAKGKRAPAPKAAKDENTQTALFFTRPAMLDKVRHAQAAIGTKADMGFARHSNSVPLNAIEFLEAIKSYPIVFTNEDAPLPVAILGWEQENYFVGADNQWRKGAYIPAYVRQYPFILFNLPENDTYYLCVDEGAPQFHATATADSAPLFVNGEPSELSKRALAFCTSFYQHLAITRNFCNDLAKHKLLVTYQSKATIGGRERHLDGFRMIDEKMLQRLPEKTFLEFREKGWLPFIYLALASATNWKQLMELGEERR